jgi:hypothetical protein
MSAALPTKLFKKWCSLAEKNELRALCTKGADSKSREHYLKGKTQYGGPPH